LIARSIFASIDEINLDYIYLFMLAAPASWKTKAQIINVSIKYEHEEVF
jgi:hypothetical protein